MGSCKKLVSLVGAPTGSLEHIVISNTGITSFKGIEKSTITRLDAGGREQKTRFSWESTNVVTENYAKKRGNQVKDIFFILYGIVY